MLEGFADSSIHLYGQQKQHSTVQGSELENGQGSLSPASASTESPGALLKWLRTDSILPRSIRQQAIDGTLAKVRSTAQKPPSRFQLEVFNILQVRSTSVVASLSWLVYLSPALYSLFPDFGGKRVGVLDSNIIINRNAVRYNVVHVSRT